MRLINTDRRRARQGARQHATSERASASRSTRAAETGVVQAAGVKCRFDPAAGARATIVVPHAGVGRVEESLQGQLHATHIFWHQLADKYSLQRVQNTQEKIDMEGMVPVVVARRSCVEARSLPTTGGTAHHAAWDAAA